MHIGYVPRESPEFPFRSISFPQITNKNPFRSITILHFLADFAVPETIIFKISLISTRSSPPTAGSARTQSVRQRRGVLAVPEIRIFTLKTAQALSGAPHFQAQNGSSSFRSPAFSRSTGSSFRSPAFSRSTGSSFRSPAFSRLTGSSFRSPCPFFTLPRHISTLVRSVHNEREVHKHFVTGYILDIEFYSVLQVNEPASPTPPPPPP